MSNINIEMYTKTYQHEVQQLILEIQKNEFQIDIDLERQPDLQAIESYYQRGSGNFWVAKYGERVVGTISLLDIGNNQVALRKMFVQKDYRGKDYQVGQTLLDNLVRYARDAGIKEIYLGTTEKFIAAQRFYEKNGFAEIEKQDLPLLFPIMTVDVKFYRLHL